MFKIALLRHCFILSNILHFAEVERHSHPIFESELGLVTSAVFDPPPAYLADLLPGGDTLVQQSMMAGTISIDNRHYYFPFTLGGWVLHFWVVAPLPQETRMFSKLHVFQYLAARQHFWKT